jgi:hypothetical protein
MTEEVLYFPRGGQQVFHLPGPIKFYGGPLCHVRSSRNFERITRARARAMELRPCAKCYPHLY